MTLPQKRRHFSREVEVLQLRDFAELLRGLVVLPQVIKADAQTIPSRWRLLVITVRGEELAVFGRRHFVHAPLQQSVATVILAQNGIAAIVRIRRSQTDQTTR